MKVYVLGYRSKTEEEVLKEQGESARRPFAPVEPYAVGYTEVPGWTMSTRYEAENECWILTRLRVHVGHHYCEFSVEELPDGNYAVACLTHPEKSVQPTAREAQG